MELVKVFDELPKEAIQIRTEVFVLEQGFREEFDTVDNNCLHFLYYDDDKAIGVARIYYSKEHRCYAIGRFAIVKEYRREHRGKLLLEEMEKYLVEKRGHIKVGLSSQERALPFYKACGYKIVGEMYLDENYPHYWMEKELN